MDKQQVQTMLNIEKSYLCKPPSNTHPKRRLIADCLHKVNARTPASSRSPHLCLLQLTDDEHISDDVFALAMNLFDRFLREAGSSTADERSSQLIALCCYNIAKKLRTNVLLSKENEQLSWILAEQMYSDDEIFVSALRKSNSIHDQ